MKPGKYKAQVAKFGSFEADSGAFAATFTFMVTHISYDKGETWMDLQEGEGPELIDAQVWLIAKTGKRIDANWDRLADALGWDKDLVSLDAGSPWVAKDCEIEVEEEEYKGKKRLRVQWINPIGGGPRMKPVAKSRLQELAAKYNNPQPTTTTTLAANPFDASKQENPFG